MSDEVFHAFTEQQWLLIGVGFVWLLSALAVLASHQKKRSSALVACESCRHIGEPGLEKPGSIITEIVLVLLFLPFGAIYGLLREGLEKKCCSDCGSQSVVPINSKRGRELQAEIVSG